MSFEVKVADVSKQVVITGECILHGDYKFPEAIAVAERELDGRKWEHKVPAGARVVRVDTSVLEIWAVYGDGVDGIHVPFTVHVEYEDEQRFPGEGNIVLIPVKASAGK